MGKVVFDNGIWRVLWVKNQRGSGEIIKIENGTYSDWPMFSRGRVTYDNPERVPQYLKDVIWKVLVGTSERKVKKIVSKSPRKSPRKVKSEWVCVGTYDPKTQRLWPLGDDLIPHLKMRDVEIPPDNPNSRRPSPYRAIEYQAKTKKGEELIQMMLNTFVMTPYVLVEATLKDNWLKWLNDEYEFLYDWD